MPGPLRQLDRSARRRAVRLSYANALVWAIGNGLVSTTLIVFLAIELGAAGIAISWVIASPRLAGVLRIGAPRLIGMAEGAGRRIAGPGAAGWGRKLVAIAGYAASGAMLVLVPIAALAAKQSAPEAADPAVVATVAWPGGPIGLLVTAWCVYHLLEYVANVALWSWLGDLYPPRARPLLLGRRERWLLVGRIVGIGLSVSLAALWEATMPAATRWVPLAASASVGAVVIATAVVPLAWMPALATAPSAWPRNPWRTLVEAWARRPFRRLLAYSCWLGVANGVTQSCQARYAATVLGITYPVQRLLQVGLQVGQAAIAPRCGRWITRYGSRRVMLPAQLLVATGPLFYWLATPAPPWWGPWLIVGAWVVWIAFAPINIGLDTLKLGVADPRNNAPYVAVYHALSDLVNAAMVIFGGLLYETLAAGDADALRVYGSLFLAGGAARALAAVLVWRLEEPPPEAARPPRRAAAGSGGVRMG